MGLIATLVTFTPLALISATDFNTNFNELKTKINSIYADDLLRFKINSAGVIQFGTGTVTTNAAAGDAVLTYGNSLRSINAATNSTVPLIALVTFAGNSNVIQLGGPSVGAFAIGSPGFVQTSGAGSLTFPNNRGVWWSNQADNAAIKGVFVGVDDVVQLGDTGRTTLLNGLDIKWGKALVALGGGAAPTLGTIGGSGPATAAQNSWMRVLDSAGVAFFVPAWK